MNPFEKMPSNESSAEATPEQNQNTEGQSKYFVGVGKNPDGSPDFSKAASFRPSKEVLEGMKKIQREAQPKTVSDETLAGAHGLLHFIDNRDPNRDGTLSDIWATAGSKAILREFGFSDEEIKIKDSALLTYEFREKVKQIDEAAKEKPEANGGGISNRDKANLDKLRQEILKPEQQSKDMKAIKATVAFSKKTLEDGLNHALPLNKLRLEESDFERWQKLADGLEEIRKRYTKDNRLRSVKNSEYEKEVSDLLGKI
jgi:hypothetical protein